jgi:hypothetical protein
MITAIPELLEQTPLQFCSDFWWEESWCAVQCRRPTGRPQNRHGRQEIRRGPANVLSEGDGGSLEDAFEEVGDAAP